MVTVSGGQVTPQRAGQATIKATWHSFNSRPTRCSPGTGFEPGPIGEPAACCSANSLQLRATASVQVAATPHHLVVMVDQQGFTTLGNCSGQYYLRQVQFRVVSQSGQTVGDVSVEEIFDSVTNNTCGNGQPQASGCAPTSGGGTFIENVSPGCGSRNGPAGCGYDSVWKWYWCNNGAQGLVALASLNAQVRKESVSINGRASAWPAGSIFNP